MEQYFPYYHILQQAPVIRKQGYATEKTRGSQANVEDVRKRDYERVSFNGKTYSKEYSRNIRGKRLQLGKTSYWKGDVFENADAKKYLNIHYGYIDRINEEIAPMIAREYGLKLSFIKSTGLQEEYDMQFLDIFSSFEEE